MKRHSRFTRVALLLVAAGLFGGLNSVHAANAPATTPGYEAADPRLQRYERMGKLMDEMQAQMAVMSKQMADPKLTEKERKAIGADMKRMSSVMRRMSGLTDRPSMKDAEAHKAFDAMGKDMSAMQKRREAAATK